MRDPSNRHPFGARPVWLACASVVGLLSFSACVAESERHVEPSPTSSATQSPSGPGPVTSIPLDPNNPANPPPGTSEQLAPSTRVARLTHTEWENSVRDLFGLEASSAFAQSFRRDPVTAGFLFDNDSQHLEVDGTLWQAYQQAASQVAELVVGDPVLLARLLPPDPGDAALRAQQFLFEFVAKVYRRPLSAQELAKYLALFNSASGLYAGLPVFESGVRLTLEAALQSPHFAYRVERSSAVVGGAIPLNPFELAARLSYALWDSTPDGALFEAAQSGRLATAQAIEDEAARLLEHPKARKVFTDFNAQLFGVSRYNMISPSPTAYPGLGVGFALSAERELSLFSEALIFDQAAGIAGIFTSTSTFANDQLARIYGLSGTFTEAFQPVTLPAQERRGILTLVGFLASNANSVDPDPIHRGVFIANRLLCMNVAAPPGEIPPLPPPGVRTNRQRVADHTEQPGSVCVACHGSIINPLGFPFENYDAVGAFRTIDNGLAVDASAKIPLDGALVPVGNALELSEALSASTAAHSALADTSWSSCSPVIAIRAIGPWSSGSRWPRGRRA